MVNQQATGYDRALVSTLAGRLRDAGAAYTIVEPDSATGMLNDARGAAGLRRTGRSLGEAISRRGPVTALVACGGDGTFNLVARAGLESQLPVGLLPMGRFNNVARTLFGTASADPAIEGVVRGKFRKMDAGKLADQFFFSAAGFGFLPSLQKILAERSTPRFAFGWSRLANRAVEAVVLQPKVVKVDSFKFEINPTMFSVTLLRYAVGLPFWPAAVIDDRQAEIVFDSDSVTLDASDYLRQVYKKKYLYGDDVRLFRGREITVHPVRNETLYLDGELIELDADGIEISIAEEQLNVLY